MRRFARRLLLLAVSCLLLLTAAAHVLCNGTMRVPRLPARSMPAGFAWDKLEVTASDGVLLRGWFAVPPGFRGDCVLLLHGIGDTAAGVAGLAAMFRDAGYATAVPDSRAHGSSGGEFVTYGLLERHDVLAWARLLRSRGCGRLYGLGESLGAAVLIQAAAAEPAFRALAAECSYADLRSIGEYRVTKLAGFPTPIARLIVSASFVYARLRYGFDLNRASPVEAIANASTPLLLIHGLADDLTPPLHSERLAGAAPGAPLWLVPGAGHVQASAAAPAEFRERVLGWFAANR